MMHALSQRVRDPPLLFLPTVRNLARNQAGQLS